MAIGEAGSLVTDGSLANPPTFTVTLTEPLTNPVFAFTATGNGGDEFTMRLTSQALDGDGNTTEFTFILEEWEYLDGAHPAIETINWLAIEEGVHTLPDGRIIEAGTSSVSSSGRNTGDVNGSGSSNQTFTASFANPPVVLTSVMSNNDSTTVDSDPSGITASGFNITLQEEEAQDSVHVAETIGWIAIQAGGDVDSGTASVTGNSVTHNVSSHSLGATFSDAIIIAETQIIDGPDTAVVSIDSQTNSSVDLYIDEERSNDAETNHTTEIVGIVAFEDGLIPCFTRGVRIKCADGEVPIENLRSGDIVMSEANGTQAIRLIMSRSFDANDLDKTPKLRPVRIIAGALGMGLPKRDLLVSPQHRMLVSSKIADRMFGVTEVLVPAIRLTEIPGIFVDEDVSEVEYFHLLFDQHEIIFAEGAPTESFYTGPEALKALNPEAREEILTIFPQVSELNYTAEPVRFIPTGKLQKQLILRHNKNRKVLLEAMQAVQRSWYSN